MQKKLPAVLLFVALTLPLRGADNWPQWRGPNLNGISDETNLPIEWDNSKNVTWKLAMSGLSGSTPIIWEDRIFLNAAEGDDLFIWCVDRNDGNVLWKQRLGGGNTMMRKQNMSSPSPVTDGKAVYVMTGTGILKGFDFEGKELWARDIQGDYGTFGLNWGYASSPLLYRNSLFVQVLHGMKTDDPSYILRIDRETGKTIWRRVRPTDAIRESPDAYTTPALLEYNGQVEIVITGGDVVTGHDAETGRELWRVRGLNPENSPWNRIVASPVIHGEMIFSPSRERPLVAIRAGGSGDITDSHVLWSFQNGPDVPSPVTDGTYFYSVNDRGIAYCLDIGSGETVWGPERLRPGTYSSSLVLADGKIYVSNEDGLTSVFRAGPNFELLAENELGEYCLSSPAVSQGQIFIRTSDYLYCIGERRR